VVGARAAGLIAALAAREAGAQVTLVEKRPTAARSSSAAAGAQRNTGGAGARTLRERGPRTLLRALLGAWPLRDQQRYFEDISTCRWRSKRARVLSPRTACATLVTRAWHSAWSVALARRSHRSRQQTAAGGSPARQHHRRRSGVRRGLSVPATGSGFARRGAPLATRCIRVSGVNFTATPHPTDLAGIRST
jgi:glycine/D-amino acid oxidase-like deaminating enzyme